MTTREKIIKVKERLAKLEKLENKELRNTPLLCGYCKDVRPVKERVAVQTNYYVPPSGCSDGGYWCPGEVQWDCEKCLNRTRASVSAEWVCKYGHKLNKYDEPLPEGVTTSHFKECRQCYCTYEQKCDECGKRKKKL